MQKDQLLSFFQELRSELLRTSLLLQQTAVEDAPAWNRALEAVQEVLQASARCTACAEQHLYPLAEAFEPALTDALRRQQQTLGARHLATALAAFPAQAAAPQHRWVAAQKIKDAWDGVVLAHLQYLRHLQNHLVPLLQRYYGAQMVQQVGAHMQKNKPAPSGTNVYPQQLDETAFRGLVYRAETTLAQAWAPKGNRKPAPVQQV